MLPLDKRIEVVLLMTKLDSIILVRRDLQKQKWKKIHSSKKLKHIFKKIKEKGSVWDTLKSGRPLLEQEKVDIIAEIYVQKPFSSSKIVANEAVCFYKTVHMMISNKFNLFRY